MDLELRASSGVLVTLPVCWHPKAAATAVAPLQLILEWSKVAGAAFMDGLKGPMAWAQPGASLASPPPRGTSSIQLTAAPRRR